MDGPLSPASGDCMPRPTTPCLLLRELTMLGARVAVTLDMRAPCRRCKILDPEGAYLAWTVELQTS